MKKQRGATVLDLLKLLIAIIVVVWSGIVIVSHLTDYAKEQVVSGQTKVLLVDFLNARKYAIEHNLRVVECAKHDSNPLLCGSDWSNGWRIIAVNLQNQSKPFALSVQDTVILVRHSQDNVTFNTSLTSDNIVFNRTGMVNQGPMSYINICGISGQESSNQLHFRSQGRAEMVRVDSCE